MDTRRSGYVLAFLLTMLAGLMGAHLLMLTARDQGCREYERVLIQRLLKVPVDSQEARDIRNEIQNFFGGRYADCSATTAAFSDTADKYLAVILSLLTGAGISAGTAMMTNQNDLAHRLLDDAARRRAEDRPPDDPE